MKVRSLVKYLKFHGITTKDLKKFLYDIHTEKEGAVPPMSQQGLPSSIAYIYKSELDFISRCILDYKNIETGGQLFGFWTADGSPVVVYAIGPGANANHQIAFFNQDIEYLLNVGRVLVHHYGLQHIGEWHSHHKLGLAQPSGHDASTIADTIKEKSLPQFLLCIGNCSNVESTLNPFNFTFNAGYNYVKAQWTIKNIDSPYRSLIDQELKNLLRQPTTQIASYNIAGIHKCFSEIKLENEGYWFEDKKNRLVLKSIIDFIETYPTQARCSVKMDPQNHIQLLVKRKNKDEYIYFPSKFPQAAPEIQLDFHGKFIPAGLNWNYQGDILSSFIKYYKSIYDYDGR